MLCYYWFSLFYFFPPRWSEQIKTKTNLTTYSLSLRLLCGVRSTHSSLGRTPRRRHFTHTIVHYRESSSSSHTNGSFTFARLPNVRNECVSNELCFCCVRHAELYTVWSRLIRRLLLAYCGHGHYNVSVHSVPAGVHVRNRVHHRGPQWTFSTIHITSQWHSFSENRTWVCSRAHNLFFIILIRLEIFYLVST